MSDNAELSEPDLEKEWAAIKARREAIHPDIENNAHTIGLALSGGGIRSATFCLGLIRALAKNGQLKKFDYLSTISGGGYTGAMLGRLYEKAGSAAVVEKALASDHTILLAWLRNNGRYLTPAGFRDTALALTQVFRSFLAALFLLTLLCLVVSGLAISLNSFLVMRPDATETKPWLLIISVPLFFVAWMSVSYWLIHKVDEVKKRMGSAFFLSGAFYALMLYIGDFQAPILNLVAIGIIALCNALLIVNVIQHPSRKLAILRQQLTLAMARSLALVLALLLLWAIYELGLKFSGSSLVSQFTLPPLLLALVKVLWEVRPVKSLLSRMNKKSPTISLSLMQMANMLGFALMLFSLVSVCAAEIRFLRYTSLEEYIATVFNIGIVIVAFFVYFCHTPSIREFLNLSSLHNFYRSRIERAWISVGNVDGPTRRFNASPLSEKNNGKLDDVKKVTMPLSCDDVLFRDYCPHEKQGPIHLISCCINQTVDDRTESYNADRKGIALTLSTFGIETGTRLPQSSLQDDRSTLSKWIAISGAAAATGMGSRTAPGLAFLLFLIGGRLGYWSKNLISEKPKSAAVNLLFAEMFARFPGKKSKWWYLSDGGHFENTGVYPLLKRRVKTIVVADCGADPEYIASDLENLVRKARIDYGISILFSPAITGKRSSLEQLKMSHSEEHPPLIEARIYYPKTISQQAMLGKLIIVKPHRLKGMGLDTQRYAERNAAFPQQTTGDQFFDEEQWEAYHQLGLQAGKAIKL